MQHPKGDCAVFTCLICAMLETLGVPWEIVVVAVDPRQPGIYSHVYPRLATGDHMALDASNRFSNYPGWRVPDQRVSRIQVFDQNGNPTEDAAPKFNGLHGVPMGMGCCAAYKGLGAAGDFTIDTTDLMAAAAEPTQFLSGDPGASVALSTPSAWDTTLAGLANQWTGIASRILAPTTTVMNPKTGLVIQTPASSTAAASLLTGATTTATTSSTLILYGVIVVGAILMFSMIRK